MIHSPSDIIKLVNHRGFLPFFANEISGFSLEEETPEEFWFPDNTIEGVWEWKSQVIIDGDIAYGKFFQGKACFISLEWFPDFCNYRRSINTLTSKEKEILNTVKEHGSLLSKQLKRLCGYDMPRQKRTPIDKVVEKAAPKRRAVKMQSFDSAITHLQMSGWLLTADFEYGYDRKGQRYGWGVARYCTPEDFFSPERMSVKASPSESRSRIIEFLNKTYPDYANPARILV